jgi:DNA-binding CsgD family transcriptional regulator
MLRHRPNCATDHQGERQLDEKKFRHNVAERFIPWVQTPSVARGVKAMKHKRLKTRRIAEQQLTVVIFCRNPLATSLIKQVLPPEFFSVKEPPAPDADLVIVEEGLLTPTEQKILHALVELGTLKAVAEHLHYHPTTVKRYLRSICRKLEVKTAPQATALAVRLGLI